MKMIDSGIEVKYLVKVKPLADYRLYVEFQDGLTGEVDISHLVGCGPVFEPLKNPDFFKQVSLDDWGAPCWPNNADIAPDTLYQKLTSTRQ